MQHWVIRSRAVFLTGLAALGVASSAGAHAFLDHAEPEVGGTVKQLPAEVRITFSESVDPRASSLKVFDASGKEVDKGEVHADPKTPDRLSVSLAASAGAGVYKVTWRVLAVEDGHTTHGDFTFRVEP